MKKILFRVSCEERFTTEDPGRNRRRNLAAKNTKNANLWRRSMLRPYYSIPFCVHQGTMELI